MSGEDDTVFGRWSRRKRAVAAEEAAVRRAAPPEAEAPPAAEQEDEETEAEALARLGLPDPDTLEKGDDFSAFMKAGVPQLIRRKALRRLWVSNPVLANLDGLNDYEEDFAAAEMTPAVVQTAYKVGRGFVKDVLSSVEEEAGEGVHPEVETASAVAAPDPVPDAERDRLSQAAAPTDAAERDAQGAVEAEKPYRPKRMRFDTNS